MISTFLLPIVTLALLISSLRYLHLRFFSRGGLPSDLPWTGVTDRRAISRARATLKSFFGTRELVQEGYDKYSKVGLPFVLPNITTGPEVILPLSQMEWLLNQPDDVLSQGEVNRHFLQADHTMLHPLVITDTVHSDVIRKELTKGLGEFTGDIMDEVDYAFRKTWGVDTKEWKEVTPYWSMLDIIGRVSNRVLVGLDLCRNEKYLKASSNFARLVVVEAVIISLFTSFLKPIFAPLLTLYDKILHRKCQKYTLPIIKRRLAAISTFSDEKKKNDYIQWSIMHSLHRQNPQLRTPHLISARLSALSFATIQSSVITLTNLLHDLCSSPLTPTLLAQIRTEILASLSTSNGQWTKTSLSQIPTLDLVLRESMRLWGFVSRGVLKEVVAEEGIRLWNGMTIPKGMKVGIHAYPVHRDEGLFEDAGVFDPLRKEAREGKPLVMTGNTFLAFSHGKHACPGRHFASQQLKLVLAYLALNYEFQTLESRPDNLWLVGSQGPPLELKIRIRRRREGMV